MFLKSLVRRRLSARHLLSLFFSTWSLCLLTSCMGGKEGRRGWLLPAWHVLSLPSFCLCFGALSESAQRVSVQAKTYTGWHACVRHKQLCLLPPLFHISKAFCALCCGMEGRRAKTAKRLRRWCGARSRGFWWRLDQFPGGGVAGDGRRNAWAAQTALAASEN